MSTNQYNNCHLLLKHFPSYLHLSLLDFQVYIFLNSLTYFRHFLAGQSLGGSVKEEIEPEELDKMAYHLCMRDVVSFARTIGVDDTKLDRYRKPLNEQQVVTGTTYILKQLCSDMENDRQKISNALKAVGFFNVAQSVLFLKHSD